MNKMKIFSMKKNVKILSGHLPDQSYVYPKTLFNLNDFAISWRLVFYLHVNTEYNI